MKAAFSFTQSVSRLPLKDDRHLKNYLKLLFLGANKVMTKIDP